MNIGQAAERTSLPSKTIRYYDEIKLVTPARRENGYREYSQNDLQRLRFLQRARGLGFSIEECRSLLSLYDDKSRSSAEVRSLARNRLKEIRLKIKELRSLEQSLGHLIETCHGDQHPDCPIIDDLAGL